MPSGLSALANLDTAAEKLLANENCIIEPCWGIGRKATQRQDRMWHCCIGFGHASSMPIYRVGMRSFSKGAFQGTCLYGGAAVSIEVMQL